MVRSIGIIPLIALAACGVGGGPPSATAAAPVAAEVERDLARSRLTIIPAASQSGGKVVVALGRPASAADVDNQGGRFQPLLARELVRQALLISARDELGLVTRDEVIGDAALKETPQAVAEFASVFRFGSGKSQILVRRGGDGKGESILNRELDGNAGEFGYLPKLAVLTESLSRTELPTALKALGLSGKPNVVRDSALLPANVDDRLKTLGFLENLTAIRDLHAAIRVDGESSSRLGALARGYAQLGILSEFHWHPAHKAFKARALLYAQRLAARDAVSPWGLWNRAFVLALVGLPREAQADLDEARKRADASRTKPAQPDWVGLIDAYLSRDAERLRRDAGTEPRLTALLRMMLLEYPTWTTAALQSAKEVISVDPECYRAHDLMCQVGGVANLHVATALGPQILAQVMPQKLNAFRSTPKVVKDALGRDGDERGWIEALDQAGKPPADLGEPSWGALAHFVRETRFVQVFRRLDFLRFKLAVPVNDFWQESQEAVAGHRYREYLEGFSHSQQETPRILGDLCRQLDTTDLECTTVPMIQELLRVDPVKGPRIWMSAQSHCDVIERDVSLLILAAPVTEELLRHARALLEISPRSAFAMYNLAFFDWNASQGRVPEWLKVAGESPALLWGLGKKYSDLKQYDQAEDYLRRFIRQSPDSAAYELLAANYKAAGDRKRWKQTLDEILEKVEDHGLDHARVQVRIANDFMDHGQWAEAKPYAEAAAESWAQWAMLCVARCYEGLKEWDQAEQWILRMDERYPSAIGTDWYRFCKRTGHGDLQTARASTEARFDGIRGRMDLPTARSLGYFSWSIGSLERAREGFTAAAAIDPRDSSFLLKLALLADEQGKTDERNQKLDTLATKHQGQAPQMSQVCRVLRQWLAQGAKGQPDLALVNATIEGLKPDQRGELELFVGQLLINHGQPDAGRACLLRARESLKGTQWLRILVADAIEKSDRARDQGPVNKPR
jgi:tetratricopeptide (TPR) repeat protein